jgi:Flp pilus assembly protein TadG
MKRIDNAARRRAATLPLTAILLIVLLGMVAFAVDSGYICWTRAELQNAADSAALAGAAQLLLPQVPTSTASNTLAQNAVDGATSEAQVYAGYHSAGGVTLTLPASDVVVGTPPGSGSSTVTAWSSGDSFPTAVQVTTRRSKTVNGSLPLFFGPVLGVKHWTGSTTAIATCKFGASTVTGFSGSPTGTMPQLLPITLDAGYWNTFISTGKSADGNVYDHFTATPPSSSTQPPNNVSAGADGIPEFSNAYGSKTSPGNFGLISLQNANATSDLTYSNWIVNGPSASDLSSFGSSGLQATPSSPTTMFGGPGLQTSLVSDLASIIGQARIVPLFSVYSGSGSNTQYTVVGFAGVTVVSATGSGNNINIVLQPSIITNANATVSSSGTATGTTHVYQTSPITLTN